MLFGCERMLVLFAENSKIDDVFLFSNVNF